MNAEAECGHTGNASLLHFKEGRTFFFFKMGPGYGAQAALQLLSTGSPPALASRVDGLQVRTRPWLRRTL